MGSKPTRFVAFVPVRGGSKSIPKKNIRPLCGRPLLYWVCKAIEECPHIDTTYVATDDEEIARVAGSLGLSKVQVIDRSPETATDKASTESAMLEFAERFDFDHVALVQATSPFLCAEELTLGCERLLGEDYDSILSVVRQTRFRWSLSEAGLAIPENYDPQNRLLRQFFDGFLVENGAFYLTSRETLLQTQCRISGRIGVVEMPEDTYFEIDDKADWTIAEGLLRGRLRDRETALDERLRKVRLVATDVDGCLTDGGMYYSQQGDELKRFNAKDGHGFGLLREAGCLCAIITAENTEIVSRRAAKLGITELHQGARDKVSAMESMLEKHGIAWDEVAYLGDDTLDLELLRHVGVSACPSDAVQEVSAAVDVVLESVGGAGVFRELAEMVISARESG